MDKSIILKVAIIALALTIISPFCENYYHEYWNEQDCQEIHVIEVQNTYETPRNFQQENNRIIKKKKQPKQKLENYISNLESLTVLKDKCNKGSIRWYIQWYERRYPLRNLLYTSFGVIILLTPLLIASFQLQGQKLFAAITTFLIGITSFFSWGTAWSGYLEAKIQLEFLMHRWEATLVQAREISDDEKAIEIVNIGFNELLEQSEKIIMEETKSFFNSIKFPS